MWMHCNVYLEARKPGTDVITPLVPADMDLMVHKSLIFSAVHKAHKLRKVCIVQGHIFFPFFSVILKIVRFKKNTYDMKCLFQVSLQLVFKEPLIQIQPIIFKMHEETHIGLHVKYSLPLSSFNQDWSNKTSIYHIIT